MNASRAFVAGVVGGAVMSALMWMARTFFGMEANLSMMLGTMFVQPPGAFAWVVGFIMHLMISGLIALIYAWGFENVTHRAGAVVGAGFGVIHAIIAGIAMGMMPLMHPLMPEQMPAPGAYMSNLGMMGVVAEFMLHVIYGAIVGAMYQPVVHRLGHPLPEPDARRV